MQHLAVISSNWTLYASRQNDIREGSAAFCRGEKRAVRQFASAQSFQITLTLNECAYSI
jgi:hypothetical protein